MFKKWFFLLCGNVLIVFVYVFFNIMCGYYGFVVCWFIEVVRFMFIKYINLGSIILFFYDYCVVKCLILVYYGIVSVGEVWVI